MINGSVSCSAVSDSETPSTVAHHVPCDSPGKYWSRLPFPSAGNIPTPEIKSGSPALQADSLLLNQQGSPIDRFSSVQLVAQLCPTLYDPMNCSMPGLPVHHQLPEFTQTHVQPS